MSEEQILSALSVVKDDLDMADGRVAAMQLQIETKFPSANSSIFVSA